MIALYARQSVERENSVSIETQLDYCRAMIKPDARGEKIKTFIDEGCSGGNTNRDGFSRMMRELELGKISKVIVYKLDRISRSLSDFVGILQSFRAHQVEFVSSQECFDTSSIYGDLILKILIIFAEFERASIISRVRDAYAKRTDMGLYMGGRQQYGFTLVETMLSGIRTKRYEPVEEALAQVHYMFEVYAQPQVSLRQLQASFIAEGIQPLMGKAWTTAKLSNLLRNPVYVKADSDIYTYFHSRGVRMVDSISAFTGERAAQLYGKSTHNKSLTDWSDMKLVLMQHAGCVSSEVWLRCQQKLVENKQVGNSLSNKTSWLAGKLVCAKCGHTMTTIKSRLADGSERRYFNCTGKSHKKICTGVKETVYVDDMEKLVTGCIAEKLKGLSCERRTVGTETATQQNALRLEQKTLELQEEKLGDLLLGGGLNAAMLQIANQKAAEIQNKKQKLLDKIGMLKMQDATLETVLDPSRRWKNAKFEEKKAVVGVLISCIIMSEDSGVEIVWNG